MIFYHSLAVKTKTRFIEASNISFGGGYVLLKLLIDNFETQKIFTIVYINNSEVLRSLTAGNYKYVTLIKSSSSITLLRYFLKRENILFFCNLPPLLKQKKSLLYFHNPHFSKPPEFNLRTFLNFTKLKYFLYHYWLKYFAKNVDIVGCQTLSIKKDLERIGIKANLLPFYDDLKPKDKIIKYDFCYVSAAAPHKNHSNLFRAVQHLAKKYNFTLAVTISSKKQNAELLSTIYSINNCLGKDVIINVGYVSREKIIELYSQSNALVFPSFQETFGLPLIEAMQCNLTIIASDRQFTHDVLENAIVFDPEDPFSIADQMRNFLEDKFIDVKQKLRTENKLKEIIGLL
jgi:glycosyltransferase involved in cell wall biosynthesis